MLKSTLIKVLTEQLIASFPQLTEHAVRESVNTLMDCIIDHVAQGGRLEIRGFGSLDVTLVKSRLARNPKDGKYKTMAARYRLHFRGAEQLRLRVNASTEK